MTCDPYLALSFRLIEAFRIRGNTILLMLHALDGRSWDFRLLNDYQKKQMVDELVDKYQLQDSEESIKRYLLEFFESCCNRHWSDAAKAFFDKTPLGDVS